jgi:hypothetical protein
VLVADAAAFGILALCLMLVERWINVSGWLFSFDFGTRPVLSGLKAVVIVAIVFAVHFSIRKLVAKFIAAGLEQESMAGNVRNAFVRSTRPLRSLLHPLPVGWTSRARKVLASVKADASEFVQTMNDRFTNPSGIMAESPQAEMLPVVEPAEHDEATVDRV